MATTAPAARRPVWAEPVDEVLARLGTRAEGLTSAEAARRTPRTRTAAHGPSWWRVLLRQFTSPIELILVGATILSGVLGDVTDTVIILTIILLSGLLGFIQEHSAGRAMSALLATIEPRSQVVRDGKEIDVPTAGVLTGDVVRLSPGDVPPGDGILISSDSLAIDESSLTGETFPAEKSPGAVATDAAVGRRSNMVFAGTHVVSGSGVAVMVATGGTTELARIASRLTSSTPATGFERGMTRFGLLLTRIMAVLVIVIFVVNLLLHRPVVDSALFSLALAVGLTPQLLPAIVGISLAEGARRMAKQKVIVRKLDAIEDFGAMTILCTDKTGTLTGGTVKLDNAFDCQGAVSADVAGLAALNAGLQSGWANPIDDAITSSVKLPADASLITEVPYDFTRRRLSVAVKRPRQKDLLITKGSFADVITVCSTVEIGGKPAPLAEHRADLEKRFRDLSENGYRVLALATRPLKAGEKVTVASEHGMELTGLLCFADPEKPDAAHVVGELAAQGISVRMITGDNRHAAHHIATRVGIDADVVFTGKDVDARTDRALAAAVTRVQVFAEMDPVQKERVLRAFRASGAVVGYLGDGINDAPPLHAADVGISVDSAVAVAKQSASIVLLEKDLAVLLAGVTQGRRTFANTLKYIFMTMSANFGNMLSMAIASVALPFLPLLAGQILLINLLTDLPATLLATDEVDPAQLRRPQRWDLKLIRNYMLVFGAVSSLFDLATFAVLRWGFDAGAVEFRSAWFVGSILTEVAVLFVLRTRGPFYRSRPSIWIALASLVVAVIAIAVPYTPLAAPLGLVGLPVELLLLILAITVGYVIVTELVKLVFWRRSSRRAVVVPSTHA